MTSGPWNDWYHCTINTYGTWLPGDPRGFRSRHHRKHVDGDYKNPPPKGKYDKLHVASNRKMSRSPIILPYALRDLVLITFLNALNHYEVTVQILAVGSKHVHVLARFGENIPATGVAGICAHHQRNDGLDSRPRYLVGKALSWTTRCTKLHIKDLMSQSPGTPVPGSFIALIQEGGLWASKPQFKPINDEVHFQNTIGYIEKHIAEGAAIWRQIHV